VPFRFFEQLIEPFPGAPPRRSPDSVYRFCRHHARGLEPLLLLLALLSTGIAVIEVALFSVLGDAVDLLAASTPAAVRAGEGRDVLYTALAIVAAYPTLVALQALLLHQTLMGNFPMMVRWMMHRYLLHQSLGFFQDEFAGRIATRVMQTALAVRTVVLTLLDILVYVAVYFLSVLVLLTTIDPRLALPLLLWLALYLLILRLVLPRLQSVSEAQADARAAMTGRVADSYTNIATVKLFSHAHREASYAREGMRAFLDTVHPQMRLVTVMESAIAANNTLMLVSVGGTSLYLWFNDAITAGAIAAALALCLRINGISEWIMWEVSDLFENIGTVRDGIGALAQPVSVRDRDDAAPLRVHAGAVEFRAVDFAYGSGRPVFRGLDLSIAAGEKIGLIGRPGRASRPWSTCCCASTTHKAARFSSTDRMSAPYSRRACARASAWLRRTPHCCTAASGKTWSTGATVPVMRRSGRPWSAPARRTSSAASRIATAAAASMPGSASAASSSAGGSASASPSPASSSRMPRSWSSTRRPRPWTRRWRWRSRTACTNSCAARR
jgi:ATP-binding cassette subfamily B multidrug efflux pump